MHSATLSHAIDLYNRHSRPAAKTLYMMELSAKRFARWCNQPIEHWKTSDAIAWLKHLEPQIKPPSLRGERQRLLTLWRLAANHGLSDPPGHVPPYRYVNTTRAWTLSQMQTIYAQATKSKDGQWWSGTILFAWESGFRRGDQFTLGKNDLDNEGHLAVLQNKTGQQKSIQLRRGTVKAIQAIATGSPALFPMKAQPTEVSRRFSTILKQLELPGSWKWIRRTGATQCEIAKAGAASLYLGHINPGIGQSVAYRHYVDQTQLQCDHPLPPPLQ